MVQAKVYNLDGKEVATADLPSDIFGLPISQDLIHQAVTTQLANARQVLAHAKDRSEVSGGGKKPWKQKGTGRARHGSIRSPLWIGGGVVFGPTKERNFKKKLNKQMKKKALFMVLSGKLNDKQLIVLDDFRIAQPKTKEIVKLIGKVVPEKKNALFILPLNKSEEIKIVRASKNIQKIKVLRADSLNVVDLLSYKYLLMPQEAIEIIKKVYVKDIQK